MSAYTLCVRRAAHGSTTVIFACKTEYDEHREAYQQLYHLIAHDGIQCSANDGVIELATDGATFQISFEEMGE